MWPFSKKEQAVKPPPLPSSISQEKLTAIVEKHIGSFLSDVQQRPKWRVITAESLASIPDQELEIAMFDIVSALPIKSLKESLQTLDDLGLGYQTIYTTLQLETEVGNGGFQQYFHNSTRHYFPMARAGYERLELLTLRDIADTAFSRFQEERAAHPFAQETREDELDEFMSRYEESKVDAETDRFYVEKKAAKAIRTQFIRNNPKLFYGDFSGRYSK